MTTITPEKLYKLRAYTHNLMFFPAYSSCVTAKTNHHYSVTSGNGLTFSEHRIYQQGDSSKIINWSVSARKGTLWVKQFSEEKNTTVTFLLDFSSGMFFSSQAFLKAVIALEAMVLFGWKAIDNGDSVACIVMTEQNNYLFPAAKGVASFCDLIQHLSKLYQQSSAQTVNRSTSDTWFGQGLHQLKSLCKKQEHIILLSDFINMTQCASLHLEGLCRKYQITALRVSDPLESDGLSPGFFPVSDGRNSYVLPCDNQKNQQQFKRGCQQYFKHIKQKFTDNGACFTDLNTKVAIQQQLEHLAQDSIHAE